MSGLAGLEPGNVWLITPSLNHYTTTPLTARVSFFINVNNIFFQKCRCKRVLTPAKKEAYTVKNVGYQTSRES